MDLSQPRPFVADDGTVDGVADRTSYLMNSLLSHKTRRYGRWNLLRFIQEVGQEFPEVRCRGMSASPRGAELAPPGTVPIPIFCFGIAATRFRRRVLDLNRDHVFQLEPAKAKG